MTLKSSPRILPHALSTTLDTVNSNTALLLKLPLFRLRQSHTVPANRAVRLPVTQSLRQTHTPPTTAAEAGAVVPNWRVNTDRVAVASSRINSHLLTAWRKTPATTTLTVPLRTTADPQVTQARSGRMFSQHPAMHPARCHTTTLTTTTEPRQAR